MLKQKHKKNPIAFCMHAFSKQELQMQSGFDLIKLAITTHCIL